MNPKTQPYNGPWPRKRHAHRCLNCGQGRSVACYKTRCTRARWTHDCEWCRQYPQRLSAPLRVNPADHLPPFRPTVTTSAPAELLGRDEMPFNLAGEPLREEPNAEGEARAKAERDYAQERAQRSLFECGGTFDGFTCGSDADPGL